ncbi:LLM class flavin-dependent oxidoreductase [Roseateles chitinivorans]|uniref:LLM class flavin-dependent oxidoreductase n=1 Tax=Roseateles chitinivorans TaxID=2917965 RepID=UPI003D67CEBD
MTSEASRGAGRRMHLGAFLLESGHHVAAWRHSDVPPRAGIDLALYQHLAREAEAACLDAIFLADSVATEDGPGAERLSRSSRFEPLTLLSALAAGTSRIGLVSTVTTSYNEPYTVARQLASLDQLSGGRMGWNLVTSDNANEAGNFGRDAHLAHGDRYRRAEEFLDVVQGLWDSWDDDALIDDRGRGLYYDPARRHVLDHRGEHFRVRGPLNVPRSPQGQPVIVQAGASEPGRQLAAASAELVFTAQPTRERAQAFYADLKSRAQAAGRARESLKILPGAYVVVAPTRAEAEDRQAELQSLVHRDTALGLLSRMIGNIDLRGLDWDAPLPELPLTDSGQRSRQQLLTQLGSDGGLTLGQLAMKIAGGRGHLSVIGSVSEVADVLQDWFEHDAADGFNLMPPLLPTGFEAITRLLVPELQRRGLFRTRYEGSTLREHLGLTRPVHRVHTTSPSFSKEPS